MSAPGNGYRLRHTRLRKLDDDALANAMRGHERVMLELLRELQRGLADEGWAQFLIARLQAHAELIVEAGERMGKD